MHRPGTENCLNSCSQSPRGLELNTISGSGKHLALSRMFALKPDGSKVFIFDFFEIRPLKYWPLNSHYHPIQTDLGRLLRILEFILIEL